MAVRTVHGTDFDGSLGVRQFYVHFVDYNKRLDEWVTEDRLDTRRIEQPTTKDDKVANNTTGINTPKKIHHQNSLSVSSAQSRPSSPTEGEKNKIIVL